MSERSVRQYDCVVEKHVAITMADGTVLYLDLHRPARAGVAIDGVWPVLLERSPYNKAREAHVLTGQYFAERGYVYAIQDVRGRWSSEGAFEFLRNEADDGLTTMQWLAAQPWCGKIGTVGCPSSK